ncbi:CaiB/BaiF CoA transferase family protein [Spirillospora sp. CA-255316]
MEDQVLSDIRILDLTRLLPGGLCTLVLADLGADVIKVEAPGGGDYARARAPHHPDGETTTSSASFRALNRNKRSVVIDLKAENGPDALLALARTADVVVDSFRPGVLDRLGIGYDRLGAANPGIVLCQISGWGQTGPLSQTAGHDVNYLAAMGLLSHTGRPDDPPALPAMQVADSAAGLFAATSILAALHERRRSGRGQRIDVSIAHSALMLSSMTAAGVLATGEARPTAEGVWSGGAVCYQLYRCEDGWLAFGALEEKFWANWCHGVGRPDLLGRRYDPPHSQTHREVTQIMAGRTREEWLRFSAAHDSCLTVVSGLDEALDSPTVRDRGMVHHLPHPGTRDGYQALGLPVSFSRTPPDPARLPAPVLGGDSDRLLKECGVPVEVARRLRTADES